jgi:hypothetical protein
MRTKPTLLTAVSAAQTLGSTQWHPTEGYLNSFDAQLEAATGTATVDIYVSNSGHGVGVKIASMMLSPTLRHDGASLPKEDQGWAFVRGEVSAIAGGAVVKQATAFVGE